MPGRKAVVNVMIRLEPEEYERFKAAAVAQQRSLNNAGARAIHEWSVRTLHRTPRAPAVPAAPQPEDGDDA